MVLLIWGLVSLLWGDRGPLWGAMLRVLRFVPSLDYRYDPGDVFAAVLEVRGETHLIALCRSLGIGLEPWPPPVSDILEHPIEAYPAFRQPKFCQVANAPAHVWVEHDHLIIRVGGKTDWLKKKDYVHAQAVDALLGAVECTLYHRQLENAWER